MPRSPCLVCLAIILAGMPSRTLAQIGWNSDGSEDKLRRSHLTDPERFGPPGGDAEQLLLKRLESIRAKEIGESLRKKYGQTPEQLSQLLLSNPEFLKERLKNFSVDDLPGELRKKFADRAELEKFIQSLDVKDLLQRAKEAQAQTESRENGSRTAGTTQAAPDRKTEPSDEAPSGGDSKTEQPAGSETAESQQPSSLLSRWLLEAANRFKDEPALRNSPAIRDAIRELSRRAERSDERWRALDKSANAIADKWARLGQMLPVDRLWPEKGFSWPRSLTPESWPKWHLPTSGPRHGHPAPSSVERPAMPDMANGRGWRLLGTIAVLTAIGIILQRVLARAHAREIKGGPSGWKLGPWPVYPTAVKTREELIRTFEYLSLLRLGPAARHWHHLAIGSALGRFATDALAASGPNYMSTERRQAAMQLTSLYERARYAPSGEPLPEAALAAARHDLCLLAGVPTS